MLHELAQSVQGPISLVTGEPPPPAHPLIPLWLGVAVIGTVIGVGLIVWGIRAYRAAVDRDPAEYAFRALARRLKVSQRRASLIRKLAATAQCAPVALLVSDHALHAAALCFERTNPSKRHREALKQLLS